MREIFIDRCKCNVCCECINVCREEVLGLLGGLVKVTKLEQCSYCEDCVDICEQGAIGINYDN